MQKNAQQILKEESKLKKSNILLFLILILVLVISVQAQEPQYETVTTMAEDVNCRECHTDNPHVIHAGKPVDCTNCHGQTLSISIPQCIQCHKGPIHQVHINKVRTEDCSYCHKDIDTFHAQMISNTLCSHCHKDLVTVHGGPKVACERCHAKAPEIVKPVMAEGTTVICQNCHIANDISALHGDAQNKSACYRCHRPGATEVKSPSEIPHFLHIPEVDCNTCHLNQETGKVYIPECTQCHKVDKIHGFKAIGLKTASSGLRCSVCHPEASAGAGTETRTPVKTPSATSAATQTGKPTPGFGIIMGMAAILMLLISKRIRA